MQAEILGEDRTITGISPVESSSGGDITFATNADFFRRAVASGSAAIVLSSQLFSELEKAGPLPDTSFLIVENPGLTHAWLKQAYADWVDKRGHSTFRRVRWLQA